MGFFDKIKKGLEKTRKSFSESLESILNTGAPADEDFLDELEETLILADLGMETVMKVMGEIRGSVAKRDMVTTNDVTLIPQYPTAVPSGSDPAAAVY